MTCECLRCKSTNTFKFLDAFGRRRVFCRRCSGSWLEESAMEFGAGIRDERIMKLTFYQNNRSVGGMV